jgi:hypothetical protein
MTSERARTTGDSAAPKVLSLNSRHVAAPPTLLSLNNRHGNAGPRLLGLTDRQGDARLDLESPASRLPACVPHAADVMSGGTRYPLLRHRKPRPT